MSKKKTTAKKALRTGTLPGVELPGHDEELTAAALIVHTNKEEVSRVKERLDRHLAELLFY